MVKRRRDTKISVTKHTPDVAQLEVENGQVLSNALSRSASLKRKLDKQIKFSDRLKKAHQEALAAKSTLTKKRRKKKVGILGSLTSLAGELPEVRGVPSLSRSLNMAPKVLRSRARTKLLTSETERMAAVLAHPTFKADPVSAITSHLQATIAATIAAAEKKVNAQAEGAVSEGKKKRRKRSKKDNAMSL